MTHPIHSADAGRAVAEFCKLLSKVLTAERQAHTPAGASRSYELIAELLKIFVNCAAAQVGANGAAPRQIPDAECVQGKCACNTTGCWDECNMRRWPVMYGSASAQPVITIGSNIIIAAGAPAETPKPAAWMWYQPASEWNGYQGKDRVTIEKPAPTEAPNGCTPLYAAPTATIGAGEGKDALDVDPATKQGKLLALADRIDHEKLWRLAGMDHHKLTSDQKDRMNAGVALRRYADIWAPGHWIVVPPVGGIQFGASTLNKAVEMAKRDDVRRAAMRSKTSPGEAG